MTKTKTKTHAEAKPASAAKPAPKPKPIPNAMHTVTPHIVCAGAADAIEFYKRAFGATETGRLPGPDGKIMHAQIRIGDSAIMLAEENEKYGIFGPKHLKGTPVTIHLYVEDSDALVARAAEAGARVTMPVEEMFWGDRYGRVVDPFGHSWSIATRVRNVTMDEMKEAMQKMAS
jgi:uncharacterized glyoxalase superfamily protein PhnB